MSSQNFLTVKPHLTTSNIYVRKEIVLENIHNITQTLDNRRGLDISNTMFWQIVLLKKKQVSILHGINKAIKQLEQGSFPFGGM